MEKRKEFCEVLHVPYVTGFSEGLQRKLRKLNIGVVPKKGETLCSHLCKLKQKKEKDESKDVVYSIPCDTCRVRYVGETGQHFCDRRNQHQRDVKNKKPSNGLYAHLKENKGHKINWEGFVYLDSERNWKRRKIKEAIYINAVNPAEAMGSNKILNLEKGYDLDPVWSGFNEEYRNIIAKKIGVTKK